MRNNQKEPFDVQTNDSYIRIKIVSGSRTITGEYTYSIEYIATGVLSSYSDHDEFYWNATGNYWEVPIERATATVTLAKGSLTKSKCFFGSLGENTQ